MGDHSVFGTCPEAYWTSPERIGTPPEGSIPLLGKLARLRMKLHPFYLEACRTYYFGRQPSYFRFHTLLEMISSFIHASLTSRPGVAEERLSSFNCAIILAAFLHSELPLPIALLPLPSRLMPLRTLAILPLCLRILSRS